MLFAVKVNMYCINMVKLFCVSLMIHIFSKAPQKFNIIKHFLFKCMMQTNGCVALFLSKKNNV